MARPEELNLRVIALVIEELIAKSNKKVTRAMIARKLGSRKTGDAIDQQVARAVVRQPELFALCDVPRPVAIAAVNEPHPILEQISDLMRERRGELVA